ncbi:hypothetical protein ACQJBY_065819 [Aegilops geniculata]
MGGKQPATVITDQDAPMKEVVLAVFNQSKHRNCLFHVKKKAEEKCCRTFVTKGDLHADFTDIVHNSLTITEFEKLWKEMVEKYDIGSVKYFKIMWKERRRWVPVYFKTDFLPLIHSTSRSEGMNAIFKDNVASTYNVMSFMTEYQRISERIEDMEREQDSKTRTTQPTFWVRNELEVQAPRMYNWQIFYLFQKHANLHVDVIENGSRYEVYKSRMLAEKDFSTRCYLVLANINHGDFACICGKFQKDGIVCAHILRVLQQLNISELPEKYYLERWKPKDRKYVRHKQFNIPMELTEGNRHMRYTLLSKMLNEMASDGARANEKYLFVVREGEKIFVGLEEMTRADELRELQAKGIVQQEVPEIQVPHPDGYDTLQDPDVATSKGRPRGRYRAVREKLLAKNHGCCSHCNSGEHTIATCENLHIPKSRFQKPKAKAASKKNAGGPSADVEKESGAKRQQKKAPSTEVGGML